MNRKQFVTKLKRVIDRLITAFIYCYRIGILVPSNKTAIIERRPMMAADDIADEKML